MSDPTAVNKSASSINTVIDVAANAVVSMAESAIIAEVPFLGYPVIKQLWEALFNWIAGYFIRAAKTGATFTIIDQQIKKELADVSSAALKVIAIQKTGTKDEIKKAIQEFADAHSALVHADGSAPVN